MGMVIGTAGYMASEQAKGLPVDKRADIWAFGAVLFEMLTGRRLFEAGDVSEMLASVLVNDPDVSSIGPHVPAHVRSVVRRCHPNATAGPHISGREHAGRPRSRV